MPCTKQRPRQVVDGPKTPPLHESTALPSTEQAESPSFRQGSPGCASESSQAASVERASQPFGPRQVLASFQRPAVHAKRLEPPTSQA